MIIIEIAFIKIKGAVDLGAGEYSLLYTFLPSYLRNCIIVHDQMTLDANSYH
jgi:hypothetical protein